MKEGYLSEHFRVAEMQCNHCGKLPKQGIDPKLVKLLEKIRAHFNSPVVINSAYRCKSHNRRVGGVSNSQHLVGTAADIDVVGVHPRDVQKACEKLMKGKWGLGRYQNFTHVDVRSSGPARW